jgi:hypothetical protein
MMVDTTRLSLAQAEQIFFRAEQRLLDEAPDPVGRGPLPPPGSGGA